MLFNYRYDFEIITHYNLAASYDLSRLKTMLLFRLRYEVIELFVNMQLFSSSRHNDFENRVENRKNPFSTTYNSFSYFNFT